MMNQNLNLDEIIIIVKTPTENKYYSFIKSKL